MQRLQQALSLGFLLLGLFVMRESMLQDYWLPLGPGPGFFPFWLGLFMAGLAAIWLVQASLKAANPIPGTVFPRGTTLLRVASVPLAMALFPAVGEWLGFRITMMAFLLFMLSLPGRQKLPLTLAISLVGSIGGYYVFHDLLGLFLPVATVDFLQDFEL